MRASWRYLGITAELVHATLQELPKQLDQVDALVAAGAIGGEVPTAADFQLGSTLHLLDQIADVRPLLADRPAGAIAPACFERQGRRFGRRFPAGLGPGPRAIARGPAPGDDITAAWENPQSARRSPATGSTR